MERQKEQERKRCEKVKEMWEGAKWSGNKEIKRSEGNGAERREALGAKGTIKHDPKGANKIFAKSETSPNTRKDPPKKIHFLKNQVLLKHDYVIFLKDLTKPRINSNTFTVDSLEFIVRDGLAVSVCFHLCYCRAYIFIKLNTRCDIPPKWVW